MSRNNILAVLKHIFVYDKKDSAIEHGCGCQIFKHFRDGIPITLPDVAVKPHPLIIVGHDLCQDLLGLKRARFDLEKEKVAHILMYLNTQDIAVRQ